MTLTQEQTTTVFPEPVHDRDWYRLHRISWWKPLWHATNNRRRSANELSIASNVLSHGLTEGQALTVVRGWWSRHGYDDRTERFVRETLPTAVTLAEPHLIRYGDIEADRAGLRQYWKLPRRILRALAWLHHVGLATARPQEVYKLVQADGYEETSPNAIKIALRRMVTSGYAVQPARAAYALSPLTGTVGYIYPGVRLRREQVDVLIVTDLVPVSWRDASGVLEYLNGKTECATVGGGAAEPNTSINPVQVKGDRVSVFAQGHSPAAAPGGVVLAQTPIDTDTTPHFDTFAETPGYTIPEPVKWYTGYYMCQPDLLEDCEICAVWRELRAAYGRCPDDMAILNRVVYRAEDVALNVKRCPWRVHEPSGDASWLMNTINDTYRRLTPPKRRVVIGLIRAIRALRQITEALGSVPRRESVQAALDGIKRTMSVSSLVRVIVDAHRRGGK